VERGKTDPAGVAQDDPGGEPQGSGLIRERPEEDVLDAGLLSAAQHVEHYEMAGYGTVTTWATQLGYTDHAAVLQQTLNEEEETDRLLTELAERMINVDAENAVGAA
jgi:ferritin-like metal-binding protein YciE